MPIIQTERYEVDPRPIGRGGFGEVFAATDLLFDRRVVIKTIIASHLYGIDEPVFRKQFFKESLISAKLGIESDYIVKVLDYGYDREGDLPFFVMEFVQGYDLSKSVGSFSWEDTIKLLDNILRALLVAHSRGVVHSDISPDNIMFDEISGKFKLNDFGLAKLLNSTLMRRGSTKSLTGGKPGFLPLLDWQTGSRTAHSDLYGLAVTIVNLHTGKLPLWKRFEGTLTSPDFTQLFDMDSPRFEADVAFVNRLGDNPNDSSDVSIFGITPREPSRFWSDGDENYKYILNVTRRDVIILLEKILKGEIESVENAISFMKTQMIDRISPQEP